MAQISCLANIDCDQIASLVAVLKTAGVPTRPILADLAVAKIGKLAPELLVCDVDNLRVDPLEMLRQLRFVLPKCVIVVYTLDMQRSWSLACHLAGASGVLSKSSNAAQLASGIRSALRNGCFTDPRFAVA
jgi:DNA-binding NarL/FixJ family response regulator